MPARSNAPAAKQALFNLIDAATEFDGVAVQWGYLTDSAQMVGEMVHVGKVHFENEWGPLGRRPNPRKDETFRITVIIFVKQDGDDQKAVEDRCWDLVGDLEEVIGADAKLANTVQDARLAEGDVDTGPDTEGWIAEATCQVVCRATF